MKEDIKMLDVYLKLKGIIYSSKCEHTLDFYRKKASKLIGGDEQYTILHDSVGGIVAKGSLEDFIERGYYDETIYFLNNDIFYFKGLRKVFVNDYDGSTFTFTMEDVQSIIKEQWEKHHTVPTKFANMLTINSLAYHVAKIVREEGVSEEEAIIKAMEFKPSAEKLTGYILMTWKEGDEEPIIKFFKTIDEANAFLRTNIWLGAFNEIYNTVQLNDGEYAKIIKV